MLFCADCRCVLLGEFPDEAAQLRIEALQRFVIDLIAVVARPPLLRAHIIGPSIGIAACLLEVQKITQALTDIMIDA